MKNPLLFTTAFLGIYAGLIAIQHGIFEMMQGSRAPGGLIFNAIGPPCQPEAVWHACYPAITLIPDLFVSGIAAILAGLGLAVCAIAFAEHRNGWLVLGAFSLLILFIGGGFVPVFIGIVAAGAASRLSGPVKPGGAGWRFVSALWPWPLVLMGFWLPVSWLLGFYFGAAMLAASGLLFLVLNIGLPVLAAVSGFGRTKR